MRLAVSLRRAIALSVAVSTAPNTVLAADYVGLGAEISFTFPGPAPLGLGLALDTTFVPSGDEGTLTTEVGGFARLRWLRFRDVALSAGPRIGVAIPSWMNGGSYMPGGGLHALGGPVWVPGVGTGWCLGAGVNAVTAELGYDRVFAFRARSVPAPTDLPRWVPRAGMDHVLHIGASLPLSDLW